MTKKICFLLLWTLSLSSCFNTNNLDLIQKMPKTMLLESIEAINLSEDMSRLSTKEDEIILKIDLVQVLENGRWNREELVFKEYLFAKYRTKME